MTSRPSRVYKAECLILGRRNLGEGDSILTLFSPDHGRFDAVARGVRKARSHMRGHVEPLMRVRVMLARGRTLDVLTQAETVEVYRALREDLQRCAAAVYAAELARRFAPEREPLPELYGLLVELAGLLDGGARLTVVRGYEAQILALSGFDLHLDACAACGARLPEAEAFFTASSGGLLCAECRAGAPAGRLVSVRALKVLRYAQRAPLAQFAAVRMDEGTEREVEAVLSEALTYVLDAEPRSGRFMHEVQGLYRAQPATGEGDVQSNHANSA